MLISTDIKKYDGHTLLKLCEATQLFNPIYKKQTKSINRNYTGIVGGSNPIFEDGL